jgi:hypothetical protein
MATITAVNAETDLEGEGGKGGAGFGLPDQGAAKGPLQGLRELMGPLEWVVKGKGPGPLARVPDLRGAKVFDLFRRWGFNASGFAVRIRVGCHCHSFHSDWELGTMEVLGRLLRPRTENA